MIRIFFACSDKKLEASFHTNNLLTFRSQLTIVDNVTISLLSELDYAAFSLDSGNYLTTNQRFDYEQKNGFSIKIRAADNGRPVLSSTQILYIMVCTMQSFTFCS